jgi:hypothetical protein
MPDHPSASQELPTSVGEIVAMIDGAGSRPSNQSGPSLRRRFGAGLVELPPVGPVDPMAAILDNPEVTESRRFCWRCGKPVGQPSEGGVGPVVVVLSCIQRSSTANAQTPTVKGTSNSQSKLWK